MTNGWIHASYKREQSFQYKILLLYLLLFVLQASFTCSRSIVFPARRPFLKGSIYTQLWTQGSGSLYLR
jgi:hypothetical protein